MTEYLGKGEIVHGIDGQGNSNLIQPKIKEGEISAINFMKNKIDEFPGQITLVPIGPLTNIAQLLTENPGIDKKKFLPQSALEMFEAHTNTQTNELTKNQNNPFIYPNKYHPNQKGHQLIADELYNFIK